MILVISKVQSIFGPWKRERRERELDREREREKERKKNTNKKILLWKTSVTIEHRSFFYPLGNIKEFFSS